MKMKAENSANSQTIEYTHTTVPGSMRSPYWKYFGFPADNTNRILTREKIICTLCGTAIAYNKNTSNLRTHLIARHPDYLHQMHQQHHQKQSTDSAPFSNTSILGGAAEYVPSEQRDLNEAVYVSDENEEKSEIFKRSDPETSIIKIRRLNDASSREAKRSSDKVLDVVLENERNKVQSDDTNEWCMQECFDNVDTKQKSVKQDSCNEQEEEATIFNQRDFVLLDSPPMDNLQMKNEETTTFYNSDNSLKNDDRENDDLVDSDEDGESVLPKPIYAHSNATDLLAEMLIRDLLPFNILKGNGFKQFLNAIGVGRVDGDTIENKIQAKFNQMQNIIKKYIAVNLQNDDQPYSLTIDNLISDEDEHIFSIYVNLIECNESAHSELKSILFGDFICNEETVLYDILRDFDLRRCAAITTTSIDDSQIKDFCRTKGIEMVPCLVALLRRCVDLIFEQNVVTELFSRVRKLFELRYPIALNLSCPWTKLKLLHDFLETSNASNIHGENSSILSELKHFIAYINPLKITLDTINSESIPLSTLVRPLMVKLFEEHFSVFNTSDNIYVQAAQEVINAELWNRIEKCKFFSESVLFDPRFQHDFIETERQLTHDKTLAYHDSNSRAELVLAVSQRFKHLINNPNVDMNEEKAENDPSQSKPRSSLRTFFDRISVSSVDKNRKLNTNNTFPKKPQLRDPIELEFSRYKCEPTQDLEQCPIEWWHTQSKQYKLLHKIARYYFCVPCDTLRWEIEANDETEMQIRSVWRQKRKALRYRHPVDKYLWYLHYNRSLCDKIQDRETDM